MWVLIRFCWLGVCIGGGQRGDPAGWECAAPCAFCRFKRERRIAICAGRLGAELGNKFTCGHVAGLESPVIVREWLHSLIPPFPIRHNQRKALHLSQTTVSGHAFALVAQGIHVASDARLVHGDGNVTLAAVNRSGNYNVL